MNLDGIMDAGNAITTTTWGGSLIFGVSAADKLPEVGATGLGLGLFLLGGVRAYNFVDQRR